MLLQNTSQQKVEVPDTWQIFYAYNWCEENRMSRVYYYLHNYYRFHLKI